MAWTIELTDKAAKQLRKLGSADARRIHQFLSSRLRHVDDPRSLGKALQGKELGNYWRYRVGDFRIVCELQDHHLIIIVVTIGHRCDIYR